jgi:Xaa-Pro aminopeptidase
MILSNEPGLYLENRYGIRLENILLVEKDIKNEYGQFMRFETLTFVPFDIDAIDFSLLTEDEKQQLKQYHRQVYELVSPHLSNEEKDWLRAYL